VLVPAAKGARRTVLGLLVAPLALAALLSA
jgi:hypothetical protein